LEEGGKVEEGLSVEVFGIVEEVFVIFGNFAEIEWCELVFCGAVFFFGFDDFHGCSSLKLEI